MKRNYKKYFLILVVAIAGSFSSCDKGFEDVNTSVDFVSTPTLEYMLPYVQLTMVD